MHGGLQSAGHELHMMAALWAALEPGDLKGGAQVPVWELHFRGRKILIEPASM
jgi:hypothetical protein